MKLLLSSCILVILFFNSVYAQSLTTPYERSGATETATYQEAISYFERLAQLHSEVKLETYGMSDAGKPLHLVVISKNQDFVPSSIKRRGLNVLLINNGIHPGEPDGVDASMLLARNILEDRQLEQLLQNTVLCIIPFYNIGGALNRGKYSRANQNGPEAYGFRGNARNLDLNRDFAKGDSRNAFAFYEIFHHWQPDFYLETHVTNGADYQYAMTYLATQADKLGGNLGKYWRNYVLPQLELAMKTRSQDICPYVNVFGKTPEQGFEQFLDTPRFSTGYATLFQTPGIIAEAHMLKPFPTRVKATYDLMLCILEFMQTNGKQLQKYRREAQQEVIVQQEFPLNWEIETGKSRMITFKGYRSGYKPSQITGEARLYYDRQQPYTKKIPFYDSYRPAYTVQKPYAYIIPQAWQDVIVRLKANKVQLKTLKADTTLEVSAYYIGNLETSTRPYEGHYFHHRVEVAKRRQSIRFFKGDYVVLVNQKANRYLVEMLEPVASDSFFSWNFFDSILQQKEHYSDYVFEDLAAELLEKDPELRQRFAEMKANNPDFANNPRLQLDFIYQNSPYYEQSYRRYPIFRLDSLIDLGLGEE